MIDRRIPPAGDPFYAAGKRTDQDQQRKCFCCDRGVVYIGHMVPTPDGDEEEVYTAYRCRRCGGTGRLL